MLKAKTQVDAPSRSIMKSPIANTVRVVFALLVIAGCAVIAFFPLTPPEAGSVQASPTEFSSGRAMEHLRIIARKPRPTDSAELVEARQYIFNELVKIGLVPEEQRTKVVHNIVARLEGTGDGKAILLVGHYDTVAISPGAGDNGLAVVGILETLRALKASAPLGRDVIALFTDGEEAGLLGAKAFVYDHAWSKDVGLVLNFDARGDRGPVLMFETSEQNEQLINEFAKAIPHPVANSLMYEFYNQLPNDTDFTVFKNAGFAGFNFACINGFNVYHTAQDNLENVSERTLQQQGSYILALTRHFGNLSATPQSENNAVYFNLPGAGLVHYSGRWITPLTLIVAALFAGVIIWGFKGQQLSLPGIITGFLVLLLSMISAAIVITIVSWFIYLVQGNPRVIAPGDTLQSDLYGISLVAFTIATASALYAGLGRRASLPDLLVGGMVWWWIWLLLTYFYLPSGTYMFVWPLLLSLGALGIWLVVKRQGSPAMKNLPVLLACAIPGIILFSPMIYLLLAGLTLKMAAVIMLLVVLVLGLILPHLNSAVFPQRWILPGSSALAGLVLIGVARWQG